MFTLPAIWQKTPLERNAERLRQIDQRFGTLDTLLHSAAMKSQAQREGYAETAREVKIFGRGEVGNMAQHGGWVAQEEIGRVMERIQETLTEIAVLSAGFEVVAESQS